MNMICEFVQVIFRPEGF